jgi:type I restriction enzyme S subunit
MKFGIETFKHISSVPAEMVKPDRCAHKGDLVIAITSEDDAGSCKCTAWMGDYDAYVGGHTAIFRHTMQPKYVSYYFMSPYFQKDKLEYTHGFKVVEISPKDIAKISIPVPPPSEQQSIVDYLDSAFAKIDTIKANAEKALNEAKALFQASLKEMLEPKEGWEEKTLKELTSKIGSGATPKGGRKVYIEKGCHLIRSMNVQYNEFKYDDLAHITDEAAEQLKGVEIQENDVLFNITGASIARCCVVPVDALPARVNQHVSILRLKQEVLPRFLSFIMNSPKHQKELLEIGEAGSTRQALTKTDLENHVICYPSLDNQNIMICTLDSLKSKVDRLQENYDKISQECDALKQAILRQVFE